MSEETDKRDAERAAFQKPEMIVALSAIALSVCGLFIALYEASIARQAERASVWPHVEVAASVRGSRVEIWVRNSGVGPARVRAASLLYDGALMENWTALLSELGADRSGLRREFSLVTGRVLAADTETETIFAIDVREDGRDPAATRPLAEAVLDGSVEVELCYCSVYDECWSTRLTDIMTPSPDAHDETADGADCRSALRSGI